MSITTYAELQSAIADFLNRDDLSSAMPTFIALAEANFERDIEHWRREASTTTSVSSRYSALPSDFSSLVRLSLQGDHDALSPMSLNEMAKRRAQINDTEGRPTHYALTGGEIELFPTPGDTYTLEWVYARTIPPLSDSATTNWLLTLAPDLYLYGSLVHTAPYLKEDNRTAVWASMYQAALDAVNADGQRGKWSGPLRMRVK